MRKLFICLSSFVILSITAKSQTKPARILVFYKTAGYHHQSIEAGKLMFIEMSKKYHFGVDTSSDASIFNNSDLKKYKAIVFLNTTGDILNDPQQLAFKKFMHHHGGFVGIHAATDTEYGWPWYNKFIGAYFDSHPKPQKATFHIIDKRFPATKALPDSINRLEEIYNFKSLQEKQLHFLITVDEKSYTGGKMGNFHPISWYQKFAGARVFYLEWGHFAETYSQPYFQKIILEGLNWVMKMKLK